MHEWVDCPSGAIVQLATDDAGRKRRVFLTQVGAIGASVAAIGTGVWFMRPRGYDDFYYGGLYCSEVRANSKDYLAKKLAPELHEKMRVHFSKCLPCRLHLQEIREELKA